MPATLDRMDDVTLYSPALLNGPAPRRPPRDTTAWVGACVLGACAVVALAPPAFYLWLLVGHTSMDWQANHADHVAAAQTAMLIVLAPAAGAVLGGLAGLLSRRRKSVAQRARTMAGGAFLASLTLTTYGLIWIIGHAQFTF
jgi:hypothetical protein